MGTCFDVTRCLNDFKVYVYPPDPNEKPAPMYKRFLNVLRESSYYTEDPKSACLFVLNLDTLDRDFLSSEYVKHLPEKLKKLRHWNFGRNHLIFNIFSGTYPDYSEKVDFPYGHAILAKSSMSTEYYRNGYDISLPLIPKKHQEKGKQPGVVTTTGNLFPIKRKYLLIFKGKRYLWGLGSETRNSLHHLHNGQDIIMLTTCKHGKFWDLYMDNRCLKDNALYDKYDYSRLILNSTFCLVPRGRRLGSFRFLESLQAGCIPISLSNGFVLPFQEVIDWKKAVITCDERQLFQLPHVLRNVADDDILSLRAHSQFLWEQYFSSIEKVVTTSIEIIRSRIQRTHGHFIWNRPPGALSVTSLYSSDLSHYPFYLIGGVKTVNYTAVVMATEPAPKGNSPLVLLLKNLCNSTHLSKIVILWIGSVPPKIMLPPHCSTPIQIVERRDHKQIYVSQALQSLVVETDAVLFLWEDTELISDEAEFGYATWLSNPDRLVGFVPQRHFWDPTDRVWKHSSRLNNKYSLVSLGAAFLHRYYINYLLTVSPASLRKTVDVSLTCLDIAMNFIVADISGKPPLKVTNRMSLQRRMEFNKLLDKQIIQNYSNCLTVLVNIYGYMPLKYSFVRADPVLFYDDVSAFRKEFRRIEIKK